MGDVLNQLATEGGDREPGEVCLHFSVNDTDSASRRDETQLDF